jgi:hypothetical protein
MRQVGDAAEKGNVALSQLEHGPVLDAS